MVAILGYLVSANFRVFYISAPANQEGLILQSDIAPVLIDFTWPLAVLQLVMVIGSLTFMYSIRNGDSNEPNT
jgi:hypothetical protein